MMKQVNDLRVSLYNFISSVDILKVVMDHIDYVTYFFVTLSFLGKLAFLNFYLNSFFSVMFFVILIISFAANKGVNIAVLFLNNIILYAFELISVLMHEYILFNVKFISDIVFKDIFMLCINIVFFSVAVFRFKKFKSNIL